MDKTVFLWEIRAGLHSVEMSSKTRSPFLRENQNFFRQISVFTKEVAKELISRKFLSVNAFYSTFPHCGLLLDVYTKFLQR